MSQSPYGFDRFRTSARRLRAAILMAGVTLFVGFPAAMADDTVEEALRKADAALAAELERAQKSAAERRAEAEHVTTLQQSESQSEAANRRERERAEVKRRRAEEQAIQGRIESEIQLQDEMLKRTVRNEKAAARSSLGAHAAPETDANDAAMLGARRAPKAPKDRDLPRAIFDENKTEVPAQTWGNKRKLRVIELVLDADGDGNPEVKRYIDRETKVILHQAEDRDYDGVLDSWKTYEKGRLVVRDLDENGDGKPDTRETYRGGQLVESQADRDEDGVRDAFYIYEGSTLKEERHDANNDGEIDLVIYYDSGRRDHAEEDRDKDGRKDTWTRYGLFDETEVVVRIERDENGRGFADTFENFEAVKGRAILNRREEDLNGDGQIDLVSIYEQGKLVRREILNPEAVSL